MSTKKQDDYFNDLMKSHIEVSNTALDEAIDYIGNEFAPDDVFTKDQLSAWAEANGYTKE